MLVSDLRVIMTVRCLVKINKAPYRHDREALVTGRTTGTCGGQRRGEPSRRVMRLNNVRVHRWALLTLLLILAACSGSPHPASLPKQHPATKVSLSTTGSVVSFRLGLIDNTGQHGTRDARLLPNGQLAVMTYGGGCSDRPGSVTGSGHQVTVDYLPPYIPPNSVCPAFLAPYTAVVRLPAAVDASLPLQVSVEYAGKLSFTIAAR